jgi:enoyl-CoA hydratase/carnithine racemase
MMLLGETWDASRALRQGLVNAVVPRAALDPSAYDLARRLAANVRAASAATKRLTLRAYDAPLKTFLGEYVRAQRDCWSDPETVANLARYRGGRWSGQSKSTAPRSSRRRSRTS